MWYFHRVQANEDYKHGFDDNFVVLDGFNFNSNSIINGVSISNKLCDAPELEFSSLVLNRISTAIL